MESYAERMERCVGRWRRKRLYARALPTIRGGTIGRPRGMMVRQLYVVSVEGKIIIKS